MNKLFESKHQQRWLEREREISARAKAIKDGTYFNVEVDPRVSHDEWSLIKGVDMATLWVDEVQTDEYYLDPVQAAVVKAVLELS